MAETIEDLVKKFLWSFNQGTNQGTVVVGDRETVQGIANTSHYVFRLITPKEAPRQAFFGTNNVFDVLDEIKALKDAGFQLVEIKTESNSRESSGVEEDFATRIANGSSIAMAGRACGISSSHSARVLAKKLGLRSSYSKQTKDTSQPKENIQNKHHNKRICKPWSKNDESKISTLRGQGRSWKEIAEILGRTPSSVQCKGWDLKTAKA